MICNLGVVGSNPTRGSNIGIAERKLSAIFLYLNFTNTNTIGIKKRMANPHGFAILSYEKHIIKSFDLGYKGFWDYTISNTLNKTIYQYLRQHYITIYLLL